MKTLFLPFALLLSFNFSFAQPKWVAHTPFPDTIGIADIHVVDENVIWAVGANFFVDDTFFYDFSGDIAYSALTTDGGATWKVNTLPLGDNPFVASITATDGSTAWVAGLDDYGDSKVLKTTDGGATWTNTNAPFSPDESWVNYVHAFSSTDIIAIGDPRDDEFEIYRSSDGGQTWNQVPGVNIPNSNEEFGFNNRADAVGDNIWFGTNEGRVYRSTDRGLNWQVSSTSTYFMVAISFADANHGVIADQQHTFHSYPDGLEANIYHTTDGGVTWTDINPPANNHAIRITGIEYVPNSSAIIMGTTDNGVLTGPFKTWVSPDRGASWMQVSTGENIVWPTFLNDTLGWAGESQPADHLTQLFKSDGIIGLFSPNALDAEVTLSPNPASDVLRVHVQAQETGDFWIWLNDAQGRLIRKETESGVFEFEKILNINHLPTGTYTLTVSTATGSLTRQFVKQ